MWAGDNPLSAQYDIIKMDLQPCEQYKSVIRVVWFTVWHCVTVDFNYPQMVLAGLRPEIIMEICSRAMSFWTYQVSKAVWYHSNNCRVCLDFSEVEHLSLFLMLWVDSPLLPPSFSLFYSFRLTLSFHLLSLPLAPSLHSSLPLLPTAILSLTLLILLRLTRSGRTKSTWLQRPWRKLNNRRAATVSSCPPTSLRWLFWKTKWLHWRKIWKPSKPGTMRHLRSWWRRQDNTRSCRWEIPYLVPRIEWGEGGHGVHQLSVH